MLDFPVSPILNQQFTAAGSTWIWDGTKWVAGSISGGFLPLTGGALSGALTLAADPVTALGATTKQYVDARPDIGDNRIINGNMLIDQRNNGVAVANTIGLVYSVDRWGVQGTQASKFIWGRNLNSGAGPPGFPYYFGVQSSSAYTSAAGDVFQLYQTIEADMVSDFAWGTANAQPVILSFWVCSTTITGPYGGVVSAFSGTRSYPFTFNVTGAWTKVVITIPGDTSGAWVMSGNAASLVVRFDLGTGSTYRGTAGAWASANYAGATGAISVVGTNGATFYITGVKLEVGSIATPFNRYSLAKCMADCQRYYQTGRIGAMGYAMAGGYVGGFCFLPVTMCAAPTIAYTGTLGVDSNVASANAADVISTGGFRMSFSATATGQVIGGRLFTATAEL